MSPPQVYNALYSLYISTNGTGWSSQCSSWIFSSTNPNYSAPCNGWSGVICKYQCQVVALILVDCYLSGTIPSELGSMTNIQHLELNSNSLTGTIPSELGSMTSMIYLVLSSNSLTGTIPSELGSMTSMIYLVLSSNSLTGIIPSELGSVTKQFKQIDFNTLLAIL